ncbi:CHAT domain-containing protein [Acrocarpospora macrocephala]|uniref:CHAT domain-containing protein n=1 Tax=Acrocarpospora macrocephala TaxID=150177 RepID=UPI0014798141|nr:CHAT domain-containing protein [Acrocarpospora macrocephala]
MRVRLARKMLLAGVEARVRAVEAGGDAGLVLGADAVAEVAALLSLVDDPSQDLPVARATGMVYWLRSRALPEDEAELEAAMVLLTPVHDADPALVPAEMREFYEKSFRPDADVDLESWGRGLELLDQYETSLDAAVLHEAVRLFLHAVPDDHPRRLAMLGDLKEIMLELYERLREVEALALAVEVGRELLDASPEDDPDLLTSLGIGLKELSKQTGDLAQLKEAVDFGRRAVAAAAADDRNRVVYLSNLGFYLQALFERTKQIQTLSEAIDFGRQAVELAPPGHLDRALCLANLAVAQRLLFEAIKDKNVLAEAVELGRESVAITAATDPNRARYLSNHGYALRIWSEQDGDEAALTEAVALGREAVALTPEDHPSRAMYLFNLGSALSALGDPEAVEVFAEAADSAGSSEGMRLMANRRLGSAAMQAGAFETALAAYETALSLLTRITPRSLARADREYGLSEAMGLAAEAASTAIAAGRPERALELLEQGRGVLLGEFIGARTDLAELRAFAPDLAPPFERLREELELADHTTLTDAVVEYGQLDLLGRILTDAGLLTPDSEESAQEVAVRRRRSARDWEDMLARIRALPGLERFLLPPTIDQLRGQAGDGPIVMINVSWLRCDALILTGDADRPVRVVELGTLTPQDMIDQVRRFLAATAAAGGGSLRERVEAQREIHAVLGWLWDHIAEPVLADLGITGPPDPGQEWPRVWWCPQRELAFLPLHAAGHHDRVPLTVLDRVVSSYTPTIRALRYARHSASGESADASTLIVCMSSTPEAPDLPGARTEALRLARLLPGSLVLDGPEATYDAVTAALSEHAIVHLACHGVSDWDTPAASRLLLHDHRTLPLTVSAISLLRLNRARLAYLSACSTTASNQRLADEAVHITAAFQLAGYPHVIGTLWPINDRIAAQVAADVYDRLTDHGTTTPDTGQSALALHLATRRLRDTASASPGLWAAHIHSGI